jgi:hypothetical protein
MTTLTSFADIDSAFPSPSLCHPIEFDLHLLGVPALRHVVVAHPITGTLTITQWTGDKVTGFMSLPELLVESYLDEIAEARHATREPKGH